MSGIETEGIWTVQHGEVSRAHPEPWRGDVEDLTYSNPFGQELERVWFDGKVVFATELGEVDVDPATVKVAQGVPGRLRRRARRRRQAGPGTGARRRPIQHLRLSPRHGELLAAVAVQLRRGPSGLQRERSSVRAGLPEQRLSDSSKHRHRELTGDLTAAVRGDLI